MTIGEQLKRERILLGITQRQMCAGIITESFYSRVENNKNEINIDDLIKILNKQHISFYDFFLLHLVFHQLIQKFSKHLLIIIVVN